MLAKLKALVTLVESPKAHQLWRWLRVAAAYVASTGVVDQLAHGTATRAGIAAAVTGLLEVLYRTAVPARPQV